MAKMPATPQGKPAVEITDESARAMERVARAADLMAQAANSPGIKQASLFKDLAMSMLATRVAITSLGGASRSFVRAANEQARASREAERAMIRRGREERRLSRQAPPPAKVSRAQASGLSDRDVGAVLSRRERAEAQLNLEHSRLLKIQGGLHRKTVDSFSRGVGPPGKIPGDMADAYKGASTAGYRDTATLADERYQYALAMVAKRRALNNRHGEKFTDSDGREHSLPSPRDMAYEDMRSSWVSMSEDAQTRLAYAKEQMRHELGGEGYKGTKGKDVERALEMRERQSESYSNTAHAELAEQVRAAQRLVEFEQRKVELQKSPEGQQLLARETELRARAVALAREQMLIESRLQAERAAGAQGQLELRQDVADEAQKARDLTDKELAARKAAAGFWSSAEGQAAGQQAQGQQAAQAKQDLEDEISLLRQKSKFLASPEGVRHAREMARLQREQRREQERARYALVYANAGGGMWGHFRAGGDMAEGRIKKFGDDLQGMADAGKKAFAALTAGMVGLGQIADPFVTMPTFFESLKMLGIELGAAVLPVINGLSERLQSAAHWVHSLSDGFKSNAMRVAIWVSGAGLAVTAAYKVVRAFQAIAAAAGGVKVALAATGIGLAIGVVGALAAEFALLGDNATGAAQAVGGVVQGITGMELQRKKVSVAGALLRVDDVPSRMRLTKALGTEGWTSALDAEQKRAEDRLKAARQALGGDRDAIKRDVTEAEFLKPYGMKARSAAQGAYQGDIDKWLGSRFNDLSRKWVRGAMDYFGFNSSAIQGTMGEEAAKRFVGGAMPRIQKEGKAAGLSLDPDKVRERLLDYATGKKDHLRIHSEKGAATGGAAIAAAEASKAAIEEMRKMTGANGPLVEERWPVRASISDPIAAANALQIQSLESGDLGKENLRRQLELAAQSLEELTKNRIAVEEAARRLGDIRAGLGGPAGPPPRRKKGG